MKALAIFTAISINLAIAYFIVADQVRHTKPSALCRIEKLT